MGKLIKFLVILVVLAAVTAGLYAFVRGNSKDEAAFKTVEIDTGCPDSRAKVDQEGGRRLQAVGHATQNAKARCAP